MATRNLSPLDDLVTIVDQALRTLFADPVAPQRPSPALATDQESEGADERDYSARLMRVNHAGEVAAQALYQGQALTARLDGVREAMKQAAAEENDHLAWCAERVRQLGAHTSVLNPLWYLGSFTIGAVAGLAGDRWSLGFVAETERQVVAHLDGHLEKLPATDNKSRAILEQMKQDEARHATRAIASGAIELPEPIPNLMTLVSRVMTKTAYWL